MGRTKIEIEKGQRFGKLVVVASAGINNKNNRPQCLCKCDCGNDFIVIEKNLKNGNTKSCGCLKKEALLAANITHGLSKTHLYRIWASMKERCQKEYCTQFKNYGGRGVQICDEWANDFKAFYDWSMANGYIKGLSIDRIDVNGNYEPSNCRWVTMATQAKNKRNTIYLTKDGVTHLAKEWAIILGINIETIYSRKQLGFSDEECLFIGKLAKRKVK